MGARIESRRNQLGKSQTWLGDACGLSFQQVHSHECGSVQMPVGRLLLIAKALGVSAKFFYGEREESPVIPLHGADESRNNRDHDDLARFLEKLTPSDREQIRVYAQLLAEASEAVAA